MNPERTDQRAEDYSHLSPRGQGLVGTFRERLVALASAERPVSILEVGCGQGWLSKQLASAVPEARFVGIDVRAEAIEVARTLVPSADFRVERGEKLPFADGEFDLVVCSEVLEHVDDPDKVLAEIVRVSKGHVVASVPHEPLFWGANLLRGKYLRTFGNCPGHIHHWSKAGFARLLKRHFSDVRVTSSFPWIIADLRR